MNISGSNSSVRPPSGNWLMQTAPSYKLTRPIYSRVVYWSTESFDSPSPAEGAQRQALVRAELLTRLAALFKTNHQLAPSLFASANPRPLSQGCRCRHGALLITKCPLSMGDQDREIPPADNNGSEWPVTAVLHVIALAHTPPGRTWAAVGVNFRWTRTAVSYPVLEIIRQRRCV